MNENNSIDGRALFYLSGVPMVFGSILLLLVRNWKRKEHKSDLLEDSIDESAFMLQVVTVL